MEPLDVVSTKNAVDLAPDTVALRGQKYLVFGIDVARTRSQGPSDGVPLPLCHLLGNEAK